MLKENDIIKVTIQNKWVRYGFKTVVTSMDERSEFFLVRHNPEKFNDSDSKTKQARPGVLKLWKDKEPEYGVVKWRVIAEASTNGKVNLAKLISNPRMAVSV